MNPRGCQRIDFAAKNSEKIWEGKVKQWSYNTWNSLLTEFMNNKAQHQQKEL